LQTPIQFCLEGGILLIRKCKVQAALLFSLLEIKRFLATIGIGTNRMIAARITAVRISNLRFVPKSAFGLCDEDGEAYGQKVCAPLMLEGEELSRILKDLLLKVKLILLSFNVLILRAGVEES
jgi:hypothetical protein